MKINYTCKDLSWINRLRKEVEDKGEVSVIFEVDQIDYIASMGIRHEGSETNINKTFLKGVKQFSNEDIIVKFTMTNELVWYTYDRMSDMHKSPGFWKNIIKFKDI